MNLVLLTLIFLLATLLEAQFVRDTVYTDTYFTNPNRIIVPVTRSMMPFQVYIRSTRTSNQRCLGALISSSYVLTTASCVGKIEKERIEVIAGADDLHTEDQHSSCRNQTRTVTLVKPYPRRNESVWQHDVAILKVNRPFLLNECIGSIRVYTEDYFTHGHLKTVGYGFLNEPTVSHDTLSRVSLNVVNRRTCAERLRSRHIAISRYHFCVRIPALGIRMEYSGGPVAHLEPNLDTFFGRRFFTEKSVYEWRLVGLLSYQKGAETANNIYLVSRASEYCAFIAGATNYTVACW